jgi:hypothetical protein
LTINIEVTALAKPDVDIGLVGKSENEFKAAPGEVVVLKTRFRNKKADSSTPEGIFII